MRQGKKWTPQEEEYLEDKWGETSIPYIAKVLGRSENAVIIRAQRMGLGAFLDNGDYISVCSLQQAVYGIADRSSAVRMTPLWKSLPIKKKRVRNNSFRVVRLVDFWEWAEEHKRQLDFSKMEKNILGEEPEWVDRKRKLDVACNFNISPWTASEDYWLEQMLKKGATYPELIQKLNRSEGAIKRRIYDLAIPYKPIRTKNNPFTKEEEKEIWFMYLEGYNYNVIAKMMNRSPGSIRGKLDLMQNPDRYLRVNRRKNVKKC